MPDRDLDWYHEEAENADYPDAIPLAEGKSWEKVPPREGGSKTDISYVLKGAHFPDGYEFRVSFVPPANGYYPTASIEYYCLDEEGYFRDGESVFVVDRETHDISIREVVEGEERVQHNKLDVILGFIEDIKKLPTPFQTQFDLFYKGMKVPITHIAKCIRAQLKSKGLSPDMN